MSSDEYVEIEFDDDAKVQTKDEHGLFVVGINHSTLKKDKNELEVVDASSFQRQTTSTDVVLENDANLCKICDAAANGIHFKALSCAACNAFFRRSVAENRKYVCRENGNCKISHKDRCLCRACRLKKCLKVGMDPTAVQPQRDAIGSKRRKRSEQHVVQETQTEFYPEDDKTEEIDVVQSEPIVSNSTTIYQYSDADPASNLPLSVDPLIMECSFGNIIEEALVAYQQLCERRRLLACPRTLKDLFGGTTPTFVKCDALFSKSCKTQAESAFIAEFLKSLQPFSVLSVDEQVLMCRSFCLPMNVIEKYYTTYKQGGHLTKRIYHQNYHYIDIKEAADDSDASGSEFKKTEPSAGALINFKSVMKMNVPYMEQGLRDIVVPMAEMKMTDVEAIGMMLIMLFNPHISEMSESTRKIVKTTRDRVFNDWHSVYTHNGVTNGPEKIGGCVLLTSAIQEFANLLPQSFHFVRVFGMIDYDEIFNDVF